jgi:hypothetical protein
MPRQRGRWLPPRQSVSRWIQPSYAAAKTASATWRSTSANVETVGSGRQSFGAVTRAETDITTLIRRTLETVGRTEITKVTAFTDGYPGLRAVLADAGVTKPPILDWFLIAMRLQHTKLAAVNLSADEPDRVTAKAVFVAEVEHWRIGNSKAKNVRRSIKRTRKVIHVCKGERSSGVKSVASRKLWHTLYAVDNSFEAKPRGWSTLPSGIVPVCRSKRRSPTAQRTS